VVRSSECCHSETSSKNLHQSRLSRNKLVGRTGDGSTLQPIYRTEHAHLNWKYWIELNLPSSLSTEQNIHIYPSDYLQHRTGNSTLQPICMAEHLDIPPAYLQDRTGDSTIQPIYRTEHADLPTAYLQNRTCRMIHPPAYLQGRTGDSTLQPMYRTEHTEWYTLQPIYKTEQATLPSSLSTEQNMQIYPQGISWLRSWPCSWKNDEEELTHPKDTPWLQSPRYDKP